MPAARRSPAGDESDCVVCNRAPRASNSRSAARVGLALGRRRLLHARAPHIVGIPSRQCARDPLVIFQGLGKLLVRRHGFLRISGNSFRAFALHRRALLLVVDGPSFDLVVVFRSPPPFHSAVWGGKVYVVPRVKANAKVPDYVTLT